MPRRIFQTVDRCLRERLSKQRIKSNREDLFRPPRINEVFSALFERNELVSKYCIYNKIGRLIRDHGARLQQKL